MQTFHDEEKDYLHFCNGIELFAVIRSALNGEINVYTGKFQVGMTMGKTSFPMASIPHQRTRKKETTPKTLTTTIAKEISTKVK